RLQFAEGAVHERLRLSELPAGLLVALDGKSHDVIIRVRVELLECQDLAIGLPGARVLRVLAFRQALGLSGAIGAYPPEVKRSVFFNGGVDDPLAVGSPHGVYV